MREQMRMMSTDNNLIMAARRHIGFLNFLPRNVYNADKTPQLFTDVIKQASKPTIIDEIDQIEHLFNSKVVEQKQETTSVSSPSENFKLTTSQYLKYLSEYRHGDITYVQKPDCNLIFLGANFGELPLKNLYKALTFAKPDLVAIDLPRP